MRVREGNGKQVVLVPAAGWSVGDYALIDPAFGPAPVDDKFGDWLKIALGRIAQVENLKRMAAQDAQRGEGGRNAVKVKVELLRRKDKKDRDGTYPWPWPGPSVSMYDGDLVAMRLSNPGRVPIDVTVLFIDRGCEIDCLYPLHYELNRVMPGQKLTLKFRAFAKIECTEHLVVLAVKAQGPLVDFSVLTQPTLEQALIHAGGASRGLQ